MKFWLRSIGDGVLMSDFIFRGLNVIKESSCDGITEGHNTRDEASTCGQISEDGLYSLLFAFLVFLVL